MRQLPKLYIRGSLATEIMANLTDEQKTEVSDVYFKIMKYDEINKRKFAIRSALGTKSIRGDYKDISTCDQDFGIAIWKGIVELLYHHKYEYQCNSCNAKAYKNKRGVTAIINKKLPTCPNCNTVKININGDIKYIKKDEYETTYKHIKPESPIIAVRAEKKYTTPYDIINDEDQSGKFFGTYAYGYMKQQLRENKRAQKKTIETVMGRADEIIAREISASLKQLNIAHSMINDYNKFTIRVLMPLMSKLEVTTQLIRILEKAQQNNIKVMISKNYKEIDVLISNAAPMINGSIIITEFISQAQNSSDIDNTTQVVDLLNAKTVRGEVIEEMNHTTLIEQNDYLNVLRNTLPEGHCRKIFNIYLGDGEEYAKYAENTDGILKKSTVAEYLGLKPATLDIHLSTIKLAVLAASNVDHKSCRTSSLKDKINIPIKDLPLSSLIITALMLDNITTISDLIECDNDSLLMITGITHVEISRIDKALGKLGLERNIHYINN